MRQVFIFFFLLAALLPLEAQKILGEVLDEITGDPLIGANVIIVQSSTGTVTDYDGSFQLESFPSFPFEIEVSYIGYLSKKLTIENNNRLKILLEEDVITTETVVVKGNRIDSEKKKAPLTVESLDANAIKVTPAANFYDGLGALKGVDLTSASIGFKVINTRGFNSTSPVRSLQTIDGVDNQAPGLNFSLGNFLGSSELDVINVDIIQGASSAYYGPNAFNGVIAMKTKNPFFHNGLSAMVKAGERNLLEAAARYAQVFQNSKGEDVFAYKLNLSYLRADDWVADDARPVYETESGVDNPGRFDAVNYYGDEYDRSMDFRTAEPFNFIGLGNFHRTPYIEQDLVDYDTRNTKANVAFHFRTNPSAKSQSPELILSSSFGSGTTVYQGDNRFSLRNILFFQNRLEFRKEDKFFIRAYATNENAGDSYDPYFTAIQLQERARSNASWSESYTNFWLNNYGAPGKRANQLGYPTVQFQDGEFTFDQAAANQWLADYRDTLFQWHQLAADFANSQGANGGLGFYAPGTAEFDRNFKEITETSSANKQEGTRFSSTSALYHIHGEYIFEPTWIKKIVVGANGRMYRPNSGGSIFYDTSGVTITNSEFGVYGGFEKVLNENFTLGATVRADKNENFNLVVSPAASLVYANKSTYLRASFSSALRNPTLSDQFLFLNVGRAILAGNLNGVDSLITVESFGRYIESQSISDFRYFDIDPIKPERVQTFEVGVRTTLFDKLFVDGSYYYNIYNDFIGFNIGLTATVNNETGFLQQAQAYRYAANSLNTVTTQGFSIGLNYYLWDKYKVNGNYSFNRLNSDIDDPIIPAFNTPEHKFNLGFSGRDIPFKLFGSHVPTFGFSVNYKWVEGFLFEGSPQFTGIVPTFDLLDAQISFDIKKINSIFKIGCSNLLNNLHIEAYGGPEIGRLGYISLLYEFKPKK